MKAAFVEEKKGQGSPEGKSPGMCKYFRTDAGCRRGDACRWTHQAEPGEKRCYVCGATSHYAKDCTRKEGNRSGNPNGEGGKGDGKRPDPKPKIQKVKDGRSFIIHTLGVSIFGTSTPRITTLDLWV